MSRRDLSEEWSDSDGSELIGDSGSCGSPPKRQKSSRSWLSRTVNWFKSLGTSGVSEPMSCRSEGMSHSSGVNTYQILVGDYVIANPSQSTQEVSTQLMSPSRQIVHLIPIQTPIQTTYLMNTNVSPAPNHSAVHMTRQVPVQVIDDDDMDDKHKCSHCGQVSSSPITANRKCGHCRTARQSTPARSLPTSDFYKSQTIRMPTARARIHMSSALQNSSPMRGSLGGSSDLRGTIRSPISNVRTLDSIRPLSQTRQSLTSLANSGITNRQTLRNHSKPEVIHLEDDCSQENSEDMATQTEPNDDILEIMDTQSDTKSENSVAQSQDMMSVDSNHNSMSSLSVNGNTEIIIPSTNSSPEELLSFPIIGLCEYAMFGTHKTQPKQIEFKEDSVKITNVSPNESATKVRYHIMIPFVEIKQLLYCLGKTNPMILIKPTHESCNKIQECMSLGANSPNGLKLDINSGDPREHYIIILLTLAMSGKFGQTLVHYSKRCSSGLECKQIDAEKAKLLLTRSQTRLLANNYCSVLTRTQTQSVALARARYISPLFRLARSAAGFSSATRRLSDSSESTSSSLFRSRVLNSYLPTEPIPSPSAPLANNPNVTNPSMIESIEPLSANSDGSNDSQSDGSPTAESISSRSSTIAIDDNEEEKEETVGEIVETTDETQEQFDKVTITYPKGSKMQINLKFN